ncbi:hypothetical protein D3C76_1721930 [compost metagenome]|uniref:hypothetical protein n=1 Tax=Pseudomonas serbica TaxID=2965074 RepID=UPI00062AFB21|nr:hypothetical protein [Pseudomonas serbica]KKX61945.1 hypothetical protein PU99_14125 [Pseudomonas putida]OMQ30474.1 hypothetical protein BKX96_27175 [Pseudomonas putida]
MPAKASLKCALSFGPFRWQASAYKDFAQRVQVRKPSVGGIISRFEGFDADGERVIPVVRRALAETATVLID